MSKSCVICGTEESEGELLLKAPCARHWVCADDVGSFFENATNNESLFPPQCCGAMFMLEDYEDHVPFEMAWAYQMKQQGEYSILAKFRIYCANPPCGKFLHPGSHVKDPETKITYAVCEAEECGKLTCVKCRTRLDQGTQNHECKQNEDEKKFKQMANEKGYQECFLCGAIVELAEACNHITCECGNSFCYICGGDWPGLHGCPHYGPAVYDEEGYNQDGYHRDTGLNRLGLTRRQEMIRARAEGEEQHDEGGNEGEVENEDDKNEDTEWEVLQHLTLDQRTMINQLPHGPRQDALDQFRITLFETQGIIFNQFGPPPPPPPPQDFGDDGDAWEDDDGEDSENDQGEDPLLAGALAGPTPAEVLALEAFDEFFLALTNEEDQNVESDAMESDEDLASVPDPWDDGNDVDAFDGHQGEYIITDEEGSQEDRFADGQSETSDFGTETPLLDRNSEETDQLETASPVDSPSQVQQVPEDYAFTFTAGTDTAAEAASLPTDGPYAVVARGFTSGTTVEDVESVVNQHSGPVIGRTLLRSDPLIVELQFATKKSADAVILLFHGKKADGQILDVRMKDEGELLDDEDL